MTRVIGQQGAHHHSDAGLEDHTRNRFRRGEHLHGYIEHVATVDPHGSEDAHDAAKSGGLEVPAQPTDEFLRALRPVRRWVPDVPPLDILQECLESFSASGVTKSAQRLGLDLLKACRVDLNLSRDLVDRYFALQGEAEPHPQYLLLLR